MQLSQTDLSSRGIVPPAQTLQLGDPKAEVDPAEQLVHAAVPPIEKVPIAQSEHCVSEVGSHADETDFPGLQIVHWSQFDALFDG